MLIQGTFGNEPSADHVLLRPRLPRKLRATVRTRLVAEDYCPVRRQMTKLIILSHSPSIVSSRARNARRFRPADFSLDAFEGSSHGSTAGLER
jgi:hypothetical protein